jgi:DNA polymerase IV
VSGETAAPGRRILHVDLDAFYASVEQRDHPELRGQPIAVAWSEEERGVVLTASYEARPFGVRSAMPTARARRLCPQLVLVRPNFESYHAVSRAVREIFLRHTPLVEPLSLDEAYLDVSEAHLRVSGLATATAIAEQIRREIREVTGLTASAGAAPNKFLAKIASDWKKPDGLTVIKPHHVEAFLRPLPVGKLPGVGPATEQRLREAGVVAVGDLLRFEVAELEKRFGRYGSRLWKLARGIDEGPVVPNRPSKSISSETTFAVDRTRAELDAVLEEQARDAWRAVEKRRRWPRTVVVKVKTASFEVRTRTSTLATPAHDLDEVLAVARKLLDRFDWNQAPRVRLIGVGLAGFSEEAGEVSKEPQPDLF